MTTLLIAFLVVSALPFFIATWRTALATLSLQGLLMAWIAWRREPVPSADMLIALTDLAVVRGVLVPVMLYQVMKAHDAPRRGDVVPPDLLSWAVAAAMIAVAFRFANLLDPAGGASQTLIAVAAGGLLLGFFVLSTQTGVFTQAFGALCVENAAALFALGQDERATPLAVRLALAAVFLLGACTYVLYVRRLGEESDAAPAEARTAP